MRNQRARFAGIIAIGATILLISILIGTRLGDHVIVSASGKSNDAAVDLPTPVPVSSASVPPANGKWKKTHVVAVATDPAFPDPRLTPTPLPPTPSPKPSPTPAIDDLSDDRPRVRPTDPTTGEVEASMPPSRATLRPAVPKRTAPTSDELGE